MKNNVLIIDTDLEICKQIKYALCNTDTDAFYTHSITEALPMIRIRPYTLIIMDILLACNACLAMLGEIRRMNNVPVLVLAEQATPVERVLALKYGADDVLNKPYDLEECLARAQVLIRRYTEQHQAGVRNYTTVDFEEILLDTANREVSVTGKIITLTRKEYDILLHLLTYQKQILTYEQIYDAVWQYPSLGDKSAVNYHVHNLRKKLGGEWIECVYGIGYRMCSQPEKRLPTE